MSEPTVPYIRRSTLVSHVREHTETTGDNMLQRRAVVPNELHEQMMAVDRGSSGSDLWQSCNCGILLGQYRGDKTWRMQKSGVLI